MRVRCDENIVTPVQYEVRLWQGDVETHDTFRSLGHAVHHLFKVAFAALPAHEPGLIELHKKKSLIRLEIWHATVKAVTIYLEKFRTDTPEPERELYDDNELRGALRRIIRGFDRARPAMLMDGGSLSETLHPFYTAFWDVKGSKDSDWNGEPGAGSVSENYLFQRFIDVGVKTTFSYEDGVARFEGKTDTLEIKQVWEDHFFSGQDLHEREAPNEKDFELLMRRFVRWIRSQPCSVEELYDVMYFGREWTIDTNKNAIKNLLEVQDLSLNELAAKMGVAFRTVESMGRGHSVTASFFLNLASVLRVAPKDITRTDGYKHPVTSADSLVYLVDDVHELREVISQGLDEAAVSHARRIMQEVRTLIHGQREIACSLDGKANEAEKNAVLKEQTNRILDQATTSGLCLFGRHETDFVQTRAGSETDVDVIHVLALFIEPRANKKP
ncbi:hypothetical protein NOV72_01266 [Caballeronia novacaledonica]|uniref:HTH cro/C1-type domain-containing protein n=2 Tax=Caballeronia novacaledonica TaxID=1544861 RepID=A0A2U3I1M9_9BURK|nr:hypothetical protein NOV72_01266 [Caballeronia novacaledonica]